MGTEIINNYDALQDELQKARNNLKGLNDNIRRMIGREPPDAQLRGDRKRSFGSSSVGSGGNDHRRERNEYLNSSDTRNDRTRHRDISPVSKRRVMPETPITKSVFSRLSGPPHTRERDDDLRPKIHSRVIRELPTRQEIVAAQGDDAQSRARNRRMFGSLLGTLQKFCQEESRLKQKEEKKAKIEKKLEEQQLQEREYMKQERQNLFSDRKRKQLEIRMLELKMNRLKELALWEETKKPLYNFIKTKTKPRIFYKPKVMERKSEKKFEESKLEITKEIEKKRQLINDELALIENRFKSSFHKLPNNNNNNNIKNNSNNNNNNNNIDCNLNNMPSTKHDRRNVVGDDEDDDIDNDNDSFYNSEVDEINNHHYHHQEEEQQQQQEQEEEQEQLQQQEEIDENTINETIQNIKVEGQKKDNLVITLTKHEQENDLLTTSPIIERSVDIKSERTVNETKLDRSTGRTITLISETQSLSSPTNISITTTTQLTPELQD